MSLRQDIYSALTGVTTNCYYQFFPDTFDYGGTGLVFFLREATPKFAFDKKEVQRQYQLEIILQAPSLSTIEPLGTIAKTAIYGLDGNSISFSQLTEQDDNYDNELKVWQISLVFDVYN